MRSCFAPAYSAYVLAEARRGERSFGGGSSSSINAPSDVEGAAALPRPAADAAPPETEFDAGGALPAPSPDGPPSETLSVAATDGAQAVPSMEEGGAPHHNFLEPLMRLLRGGGAPRAEQGVGGGR